MRPMPELKVVEIPTDELVEYENNARLHPHEQIDQIANSISEFGNNDPIAVWHNAKGEPEIVEGHGRLMALRKLGIEKAPVIFLDHLTDEQRRTYSIVHNQTTDNSSFDFAIVDSEVSSLDFDWDSFGVEKLDFDAISDLLEEEFASSNYESEIFNVTFSFPIQKKEAVEHYIKENGKDSIVSEIVRQAEQWA